MAGQTTHHNVAAYPDDAPELQERSDSSHRCTGGRKQGSQGIVSTFAARQVLPLLEAFSQEIEGVKSGKDDEHLHRMRVASRRVRAALHTFRFCFTQKKYRKFNSDTRNITRALGQARDADVQIAFLKKVRKRLAASRHAIQNESQVHSARAEAIQYLLIQLRRERTEYQENVLRSLEKFERQQQLEAIRNSILTSSSPSGQQRNKPLNYSTLTLLSAEHIGQGIIDLHAYASWLQYPDAITEHHAMRISAKHLRYTMELFAPLYRRGLKKYITRIARLQQLLGRLHDTDVWIDMVTLLLLKERSRPKDLNDPRRPGPEVTSGLKLFLLDREKERVKLFRQTIQYWNRLQRMNLFGELKREIAVNGKVRYTVHPGLPEEARRDLVCQYSQIYPGGVAHSLHVAHLSVQMFDQLQEVHGLSQRERSLLEYGALLHDIGWRFGKAGHARRSEMMIQSAEHLPFTMEERGIVGLVAYSHRGKSRFETSGYFNLLPHEQQRIIRILAGMLRVADGLDGVHRTRVTSLQCDMAPDSVTCTIFASSDCSEEISLAKEKAEVLAQALGKPFQFTQDTKDPFT